MKRDPAAYDPRLVTAERPATREWQALPLWARDTLVLFVQTGQIETETTVWYALCNDLRNTVACADDGLILRLRELCVSIYCYLPHQCHGSAAKVAAWTACGGLQGLASAQHAAQAARVASAG